MKKIKVQVTLEVLTGLHIGIGGDKAQIGGIDSPVIKDPITKVPYIPGSSLKGKLRCLLETEADIEYPDGVNNPKINKYFGATSEYTKKQEAKKKAEAKKQAEAKKGEGKGTSTNISNPSTQVDESISKFIFRDLKMIKAQHDKHLAGIYPLEVKTEISINRNTGIATSMGPRSIERIPRGTKFENVILFRYKTDVEFSEIENVR
ncbi:type III-A CRISPR-associated RAMP protein Csm3 [Ignavibacteriales bacterium]